MNEVFDWLYGKLVGFLGDFFADMNSMGAELFELAWVKAIVQFFSYFGWALFITGIIVAVFDTAIEYSNGRGDIRGTALNAIKALFAVSLFSVVPVRLYTFCVNLQGSLSRSLVLLFNITEIDAGRLASIGEMSQEAVIHDALSTTNPFNFFLVIALGYCVIKVFFSNLKRGGILLIQLAVGSLHQFSVPRGYTDNFIGWCKQVIALCLTAFLQSTILIAGLLTWRTSFLLGLGLMLAATEVERIAGHFGLDTSVKANIMSAVYATNSVVNMTKSVFSGIAKGG